MYNDNNAPNVTLGVSSLIGTRPDQQDSVYAEILEDSVVAVLCDGMGGLERGELASRKAVEVFAEDYEQWDRSAHTVPDFLRQEAIEMDMVVSELCDEAGNGIKAGTTVCAVVISDYELYWLSVGDSRIYIIRGDEIMAVNKNHNYRMKLDEALEVGDIDESEYKRGEGQADSLISYLGIGNLDLMDINNKAFNLTHGDIIVICSDGLYRTLSEDKILEVINQNLPDTQVIADTLTKTAVLSSLDNQDNTSAVVIHCL